MVNVVRCVVGVEWWVLNGGHNGECCTVCGGR